MIDHVSDRAAVIAQLRSELVGPEPAGQEIDTTLPIQFEDERESYGPWRQSGSGEEILLRDSPTKRYGIGVLFPFRTDFENTVNGFVDSADNEAQEQTDAKVEPPDEHVGTGPASVGERESEDFDLSLANAYQPSSLGLSYLADFPPGSSLVVTAEGGRYAKWDGVTVKRGDGRLVKRTWWLRRPVEFRVEFLADSLSSKNTVYLVARTRDTQAQVLNANGLDLCIEVFSRQHDLGKRLLTVCLVNRTKPIKDGMTDEFCLFQSHLNVAIKAPSGEACILPYPEAVSRDDPEQDSLTLLYRHAQTFATGHGCSANWIVEKGAERASAVRSESFPVVETPNTTPDIRDENGNLLEVSMAALAGLSPGDDGQNAMATLVDSYARWVDIQRARAVDLPERLQAAASDHLRQCVRAITRMRDGLAYIRDDQNARKAFQFANHAILLQQIVTTTARYPLRRVAYDKKSGQTAVAGSYKIPDVHDRPSGRGMWRAFQIAFLLASIHSAGEGEAPDRALVDLIWFPTGGGKTEAYLGLAAFAMFKRRIDNPADVGVNVLMRYTLRLLTAQQFQRASSLILAMEYLRRCLSDQLGDTPFSAGIWLGSETTPNKCEQAEQALRDLERSAKGGNKFLLTRCPWCGAQFGRVDGSVRQARAVGRANALVVGYVRQSGTVAFRCPDSKCEFSDILPIYVIDDDVYEKRPTLVIGTIDKFALLAWRPEARALFGIDATGERIASPPGLIIQDELHLISGPLGSMAGLYETTIEELCTDRRSGQPVIPKIVSSTATIRRYADQIRSLYAREDVALFPPPGLDAGDSFFARYDTERPGRIYVGVHAVSLGSVQTEWVRTFTALAQAPMALTPAQQDPWWTIPVFFNSIREMGTAHTLFLSDVPDYAKVIWQRRNTANAYRRYLNRIKELTGGLPSDEITGAIEELGVACEDPPNGTPVDVCLASSIIEVGIDIPRLSLMVVAGQPKTTSQYIQVTGRVGRLHNRPGLVITMYSPSKPRDRSHFERFRSYHERLYAHVEPTSVTPFSAPALDRALHAVLVAYVRQIGKRDGIAAHPSPFPSNAVERFRSLVSARIEIVDKGERETLERVLDRRIAEWKAWQRIEWSKVAETEDVPLLRTAGQYASPEQRRLSWATPTSMRNVDAECQAEITTLYLRDEAAADA